MKTFKGTKGKWKKESLIGSERFIIFSGKTNIADCWGSLGKGFPSKEEIRHNAKLISAAPELLEALQFLYNDLESWSSLHGSTKDKIEQAINKAL